MVQDQNAPLSCQVGWMHRRRELEEMPTARISAAAAQEAPRCSRCCCGEDGQVARLLAEQNRLLCDILGAVSSLTATQLALCRHE